ncbi:MAG: hypothetical protein KBT19_00310 [Lachnospiraceae bacterium]|nr:hypothetical protein [Candidatus Colinaster equi]
MKNKQILSCNTVQSLYKKITQIYVATMFILLPLIMTKGYENITETKYVTVIVTTGIMFVGLIVTALLDRFGIFDSMISAYKICLTDVFVALWEVTLTASMITSPSFSMAFHGENGWYMGWLLYSVLFLAYVCMRICHVKPTVSLWNIMTVVSGVVCIIGIADRFGIYLLPISVREMEFISTIGNINWICGYFAVVLPIIIYRWVLGDDSRVMSGIVAGVACVYSIVQGSDSMLVIWLVASVGCLISAIGHRGALGRLCCLIGFWLLADFALSRVMTMTRYTAYTYHINHLCVAFGQMYSVLALGTLLLAGGILLALGKDVRKQNTISARIIKWSVFCVLAIFALYVAAPIIEDLLQRAGIIGIRQMTGMSVSWMNGDIGNGRTTTMVAGLMILKDCDVMHMLLGYGPDCFAVRLSQVPDAVAYVSGHFDTLLTNAHCTPITQLVNTGVLGTVSYYGMMIAGVARCVRIRRLHNAESDVTQTNEMGNIQLLLLVIICYAIYGLIAFDTVVNYPLIIMILAMAANEGVYEQDK